MADWPEIPREELEISLSIAPMSRDDRRGPKRGGLTEEERARAAKMILDQFDLNGWMVVRHPR